MVSEYNSTNPKLLNSIVCFTDILGFSNLVAQTNNISQGNKLLKDLHGVLNTQYSSMREMNPNGQFKTFTDNIILAYPISEANDGGEMATGGILMSFIEYQLNMVLKEYFVRGGISNDFYYGDSDFAYGPALIEAYSLESNIAIYPRIILSEAMVDLIAKQLNYYAEDIFAPQYHHVMKDEDNKCFLNYLVLLHEIYEEDEDCQSYIQKIHEHKQIVESKLCMFKGESKLYSKYEWVAQYHNYYCKEYICDSVINTYNLLITNVSPRNFQRITSNSLIY